MNRRSFFLNGVTALVAGVASPWPAESIAQPAASPAEILPSMANPQQTWKNLNRLPPYDELNTEGTISYGLVFGEVRRLPAIRPPGAQLDLNKMVHAYWDRHRCRAYIDIHDIWTRRI